MIMVSNNIQVVERLYEIYSEILQQRWISDSELELVQEISELSSLSLEHQMMAHRILYMVRKQRVKVVNASMWPHPSEQCFSV